MLIGLAFKIDLLHNGDPTQPPSDPEFLDHLTKGLLQVMDVVSATLSSTLTSGGTSNLIGRYIQVLKTRLDMFDRSLLNASAMTYQDQPARLQFLATAQPSRLNWTVATEKLLVDPVAYALLTT